jgi:hypothetical protein
MAADLKHLDADALKALLDERVEVDKASLDDLVKHLKAEIDHASRLVAEPSATLLDLIAKAADARVTEFTLDRDGGELQFNQVCLSGAGLHEYLDMGRSTGRIFGPPLKAGRYRVVLLVLPVDDVKVEKGKA